MTRFSIVFSLFLLVAPQAADAQRWTSEEKQVLDAVTECYELWEVAVNSKNNEDWLETCPSADDFTGWWTSDGAVWNMDAEKRTFPSWVDRAGEFHLQNIQPQEIKVYGDMGLIWFYAVWTLDDAAGNRVRYEEKRFEVHRRTNGQWRWTGGMAAVRNVGDFVDQ